MNFEEIKARLQNGESLDTIAQEMEDMLNQANAFVQEEKVKSEKESRLNSLADTIAAAATEYMHLTCPDVDFEVSGAEMRETLDEMLPLLDMFKNISVKVTSVPVKAKHTASNPKNTPEDVFANFFKSLNI
jgi:hypothetical protein